MPVGRGSIVGAPPAVAAAMKEAFTVSIEHLYRVSLAIAALGLLVTLLLPELPLRRTPGAPPPIE